MDRTQLSGDYKKPTWEGAVRDLAARVAGTQFANELVLLEDPGLDRGYRRLVATGRLELAASDPISACVGLHHHLRQSQGIAVHWPTTTPLSVSRPADYPELTGRARVRDQYMLNFCTFSYSTANWSWKDWEHEIDWMALHGITMPLVLVGHEAVLADVYRRLGCDNETILSFLGEPLYLPFQYMGCRDGQQIQLTAAELERRGRLGRRVLDRMRSLGMRPVLPGFTGHIPRALAPSASRKRHWQGNTTWFLDPSDARFALLAREIVRAQRDRLGPVTHVASDPFIETPPIDEHDDFPFQVAQELLRGFREGEPGIVWVLQAWPFVYQPDYWTPTRIEAFLSAIPEGALLVLDLWAEQQPVWRTIGGFRGHKWHWCGLLNFGGRSDAIANLPRAHQELEAALATPQPPSGLGMSMESIHHNGVFFELLADLAWGEQPDLNVWIRRFARERYGRDDHRLADAWSGLLQTLYDARGHRIFPEDFRGVLLRRPRLTWLADPASLRRAVESQRWFDAEALTASWRLLLDAVDEDPSLSAGPLGLDLIEIGQAACSRVADELVLRVVESADPALRSSLAATLNTTLLAFDDLFGTHRESRLASWESAARSAAPEGIDPTALIRSARRLISSWNERTGTELEDYSGRLWQGLVGGYYRERLAAWVVAVELASVDPALAEAELDQSLARLHHRFIESGADARPSSSNQLAAFSRRGERLFTEIVIPALERSPR